MVQWYIYIIIKHTCTYATRIIIFYLLTAESKSSQEKFKLPFIIVLVMLLIVFLILGVLVIYRRHQMQQSNVQLSGNRTGSITIAQTDASNDQGNSLTRVWNLCKHGYSFHAQNIIAARLLAFIWVDNMARSCNSFLMK